MTWFRDARGIEWVGIPATTGVPVRTFPRSAWTRSAPGGTPLRASAMRGVAVHWLGPPCADIVYRGDTAAVRKYLEQIRIFHTRTRGWSDIAYQAAVDGAGNVWGLRGWGRASAANGDGEANRQWGAVVCLLGQGQTPTPEMYEGLLRAIDAFRGEFPDARRVATHNDVRPHPTACPGPDLTRFIRNLNTGRAAAPAPQEDDDMTPAQFRALLQDPGVRAELAEIVWTERKFGGRQIEDVLVDGANAAKEA